jgi:hypothetical protein
MWNDELQLWSVFNMQRKLMLTQVANSCHSDHILLQTPKNLAGSRAPPHRSNRTNTNVLAAAQARRRTTCTRTWSLASTATRE